MLCAMLLKLRGCFGHLNHLLVGVLQLKFVSFVSVVALVALVSVVSLRVFAQHKHRAQQALYYRILYHEFPIVTSEAKYRVE
jgi:hypothetical protein